MNVAVGFALDVGRIRQAYLLLSKESAPDLVDQGGPVAPGGAASLHDLERRLAPYFERAEPRRRAVAYGRGLLRPAERKNRWQVAEVSGDTTLSGVQHLRRRALSDPDAVREELRTYGIQHLSDPNGVLVIDATGFPTQVQRSAVVARP